jgi:hypothetical protein
MPEANAENSRDDTRRMVLFGEFTQEVMSNLGKNYVSTQILPTSGGCDTILLDRKGKISRYRSIAIIHQTDKFKKEPLFDSTKYILERHPDASILVQLQKGFVPRIFRRRVINAFNKSAKNYKEKMEEAGYNDYELIIV